VIVKLLAGKLIKKAAKKLIAEKLKVKIVTGLGDLLVKSTKNKLDDKVWTKVKKALVDGKKK
tara:strand:+ start:474 stop:659 length:186 start_codon:yes stop_codon:yes gene_type:complete